MLCTGKGILKREKKNEESRPGSKCSEITLYDEHLHEGHCAPPQREIELYSVDDSPLVEGGRAVPRSRALGRATSRVIMVLMLRRFTVGKTCHTCGPTHALLRNNTAAAATNTNNDHKGNNGLTRKPPIPLEEVNKSKRRPTDE